jgi:hypothetical protein
MANVFPTLSESSAYALSPLAGYALAKYPVAQTQAYITRKLRFLNDTEQRFTARTNLFGCNLKYTRLNGYDLGLLVGFWETMRGSYIDDGLLSVFSITLSGNTYNYCTFINDSLPVQVDQGELFSLQMQIVQVRPN